MASLLAVARLGRTARLKSPLLFHLSRSNILSTLLAGGHEHVQNLSSHVALDAPAGRKYLKVPYIGLYKDSPYQAWTRLFTPGTNKIIEVVVPFMGESIYDGTPSKFLKKPRDRVKVDEAIAQVEKDKVTIDVNSPESSFIENLVAKEGYIVVPGTKIVIISKSTNGEKLDVAKKEKRATQPSQPSMTRKKRKNLRHYHLQRLWRQLQKTKWPLLPHPCLLKLLLLPLALSFLRRKGKEGFP